MVNLNARQKLLQNHCKEKTEKKKIVIAESNLLFCFLFLFGFFAITPFHKSVINIHSHNRRGGEIYSRW